MGRPGGVFPVPAVRGTRGHSRTFGGALGVPFGALVPPVPDVTVGVLSLADGAGPRWLTSTVIVQHLLPDPGLPPVPVPLPSPCKCAMFRI